MRRKCVIYSDTVCYVRYLASTGRVLPAWVRVQRGGLGGLRGHISGMGIGIHPVHNGLVHDGVNSSGLHAHTTQPGRWQVILEAYLCISCVNQVIYYRVMAVRDPVHYRKKSRTTRGWRTFISVSYWLFSILSVMVVLVPQVIKNWPFPSRYSCQVWRFHNRILWKDLFTFSTS